MSVKRKADAMAEGVLDDSAVAHRIEVIDQAVLAKRARKLADEVTSSQPEIIAEKENANSETVSQRLVRLRRFL